MILRDGTITDLKSFAQTQEASVTVTAAPAGAEHFLPGTEVKVLLYPHYTGPAQIGERIRFDCSALAAKLGTGGYALAIARLDHLPPDTMPPNSGHMVKARYTPAQTLVSAVEEQDSPYHERFVNAKDLSGLPVIVLDLHSQLPAVLTGIRQVNPDLKVAYIWTDGAALPAGFSRSLQQLKDSGWLQTVITSGQAFGGDYEAISDASSLLAARLVAEADIAIIGQGPGNAGTGTLLGYSGFENASIMTIASLLGGRVCAALRISAADRRERHFGVSHHSLTLLKDFVPVPVTVPFPVFPSIRDRAAEFSALDQGALIPLDTQIFHEKLQADRLQLRQTRHQVVPVETEGLLSALRECPVRLSTMGRSLDQDAALFLAAATAGTYVAKNWIDTAPLW